MNWSNRERSKVDISRECRFALPNACGPAVCASATCVKEAAGRSFSRKFHFHSSLVHFDCEAAKRKTNSEIRSFHFCRPLRQCECMCVCVCVLQPLIHSHLTISLRSRGTCCVHQYHFPLDFHLISGSSVRVTIYMQIAKEGNVHRALFTIYYN